MIACLLVHFFCIILTCFALTPVIIRELTSKQSDFLHPNLFPIFSKVTFKCAAKSTSLPTFTWYKNGKAMNLTVNPRLKLTEGDLTIYDLDWTDAGVYQCEATNEYGHEYSDDIVFNVASVFLSPYRESDAEIFIDCNIGEAIQIDCPNTTFMNFKYYNWGFYNVTKPTFLELNAGVQVFPNGTLFIGNLTQTNIKTINANNGIHCMLYAKNRWSFSNAFKFIPREERLSDLPVSFKKGISGSKEVAEGEIIKLFCSATGRPTPNITWYHNDKKVENIPPFNLSNNNQNLKITVTMDLSEYYTCKAMNTIQGNVISVESYMVLIVKGLTTPSNVKTKDAEVIPSMADNTTTYERRNRTLVNGAKKCYYDFVFVMLVVVLITYNIV